MNFRLKLSKSFLLEQTGLLILWICFSSFAHSKVLIPQDTVRMLLLDNTVLLQSTDAVNAMYNFKFDKAEKEFTDLKKMYATHPLPYFLLGLSEWWKIMPNIDNERYDVKFTAYMDTAIYWGDRLYDDNEDNVEASFFLAAAYGFKARLFSERHDWRKAALAGKNALKYLEKSKGKKNLSTEFLFGDGLYNYYSVWIPENYKMLKPILFFFPKGDKALGLKELKEVSNFAFYTRTEAQYFLMNIYALSENDNQQAMYISKYLAETYPDNSYFQRFYARLLYYMGNFREAEQQSLNVIEKINKKMPGYEATSGRYASFFLGQIYEYYQNIVKAKEYYTLALDYSKSIQSQKSGYYLYSLTNLAQIAIKEKDNALAAKYYRELLEFADKDHPTYKEAQDYFKKNKKKEKGEKKEKKKRWFFFD